MTFVLELDATEAARFVSNAGGITSHRQLTKSLNSDQLFGLVRHYGQPMGLTPENKDGAWDIPDNQIPTAIQIAEHLVTATEEINAAFAGLEGELLDVARQGEANLGQRPGWVGLPEPLKNTLINSIRLLYPG